MAVNFVVSNMDLGNQFYPTLECESGFKYWAFAPNKFGGSANVAQFIPPTFLASCKGDYDSAKDQIICAAQLFKKHQESNWDCWCLAFGRENEICKERFGW